MFARMLKNDIGRNKAISLVLCLFITVSSALAAGAFGIITEMSGSMDAFYEQAKPPHYIQMVTGGAEQAAVDAFSAGHELLRAQQTLELLGIDNSHIYYGDNPEPYDNSVMENSFVTQSPYFDFLVDENNRPVTVGPGQIAAPLYTADAYGLKTGDGVTVRDGEFETRFTVACFIRDSQMNASLVSSKRFLIHSDDYNRLKANTGETEYLIEFLLSDPSRTGEFEADYLAAGLPSGVAITYSVIRMMNAITGGLSAAVLVLASLLLIVIAIICLRFTIMAALEEEYREIGVMKAIGVAPDTIRKLYAVKYYALSGISCAAGFLLSLLFSPMFTQSVRLYMGRASASAWTFLLPLLGASAVFAVIAGFCSLVLRGLRKISAVDALSGTEAAGRRNKKICPVHKSVLRGVNISLGVYDVMNRPRNYLTPVCVFMLCTFLIIVPVNFLNTVKSPGFIGYTGVGYCDALITLRHSANIGERYAAVLAALAADSGVSAYAGRVTANYKTMNPDGKYENIGIQNGDFTVFPVSYLRGAAPLAEGEIALSLLNARELGKSVGDTMSILVDGELTPLTVSGIYQDLTNGGKSAQAHLPYRPENVLWYTVSLNFTDTADAAYKLGQYNALFAPAKAVSVGGYIAQTFASTIGQLELLTRTVTAVAAAVAALITALFLKMILVKDRGQIIIMKGLGFTAAHIETQYKTAVALCLLLGAALGTAAANTLGERLIGALMGGMGASNISFVIEPFISFAVYPALLAAAAAAAAMIALRSIRGYGNYIIID